jgi:hypothetical protein
MNPAVLSVRPAFFQVPAHQDQDLYEWWRSDAFAARRQKLGAGWRLMAVPHSCNRPPADQFGTG